LLFALLAALAFGCVPILGKQAFAEGLDPQTLLAWRFAIGSAVLWTLALVRPRPATIPASRRVALVALGVVYAGNSTLFFLALERIPAATTSLVFYVYPALVSVMGFAFLKRRVRPAGWAALGLSLAGVALTVGAARGPLDARGVGLALLAAVVISAYLLLSESAVTGIPALGATAHVLTGTALACWTWQAVTGRFAVPPTTRAWVLVFVMATLSTAFSILAMLSATRRIGAGPTSIVLTLEPAFTATLAALFLGESLTPRQVLGGALVLGGVALVRVASLRTSQPLADA
jgi:drug/metabolite transporter (DMT)-like permease